MKNILIFATYIILATGCNMNPNKEARIQQLESEMQQALEKIDKLEIKYQAIDSVNLQLKSRVLELEKE